MLPGKKTFLTRIVGFMASMMRNCFLRFQFPENHRHGEKYSKIFLRIVGAPIRWAAPHTENVSFGFKSLFDIFRNHGPAEGSSVQLEIEEAVPKVRVFFLHFGCYLQTNDETITVGPMKKILMPLPSYGFDPTEAAIPWKLLTDKGLTIYFATPDGKMACADRLMLKGDQLGIWKPVLRTRQDAVEAYAQMEKSENFCHPIRYSGVVEADFNALILPGGHDKGVKEFLESEVLQKLVGDFFIAKKPVGAICHGVVLLARSINPETGKSVIYDYQTTSLLKSQELLAFNMTRLWLKDYYRTYPEITVEDEVTSVLLNADQFIKGSKPMFRDSADHLERGFVVRDRNYISARWPGDAYRFSTEFIKMVHSHPIGAECRVFS